MNNIILSKIQDNQNLKPSQKVVTKLIFFKKFLKNLTPFFLKKFMKSLIPYFRKAHKLDFLNITLTYQCQLRCSMCVQVDVPEGAVNSQNNFTQIPLELIKDRISEIKTKLVSVYLFGGEPLIYKDIFKLSDFLTEKKIAFHYSSNGLLLKKYTNEILNSPPETLSVSFDGYEGELHDKIRGLRGSWRKAIEGMKFLNEKRKEKNQKFPRLKIHFTITPENFHTMKEFYKFYINEFPDINEIKFHVPRFSNVKMGIDYFEVMQKEFNTNCMSYLGNSSDEGFVKDCMTKINVDVLYNDLQWLLKQKNVSYLGPTDKVTLKTYFKYPDKKTSNRKCFCFRSLSIQPNGDISNCGDFPDLNYGNIQDVSIEDAWKSDLSTKWQNYLSDKGNPGVLCKCSRLFKTVRSIDS